MQRVLMTIGMVVMLAACTSVRADRPVSPTFSGDPAHPARTTNWVRSELYFATGALSADAGPQEAKWRAFLDAEVTPRFPDGLTVIDGYGQWLDRGARTPERLRSKVLVILHADTPEQRDRIDAVRAAWKRLSGDDSVLWVRQPAEVSF